MTRTTIPRNLKKKLSASLENLTPRQAGRLFLILHHEAQDKGFFPLDYPPFKDLDAAWDRRLDQAKRSKAGEAFTQEAKLYNGWLFFRALVGLANMSGSSDVWPLLYKVQFAWNRIDRLLLMDSFSEVARLVDNYLTGDQTPRPASRDEYARLTAWAEEDALEYLENVADYLVDDWLEGQGFEEYRADEDFIRAYNAAQGETGFNLIPESKGSRRAWAEAQGDRLLQETFADNRDDLEAWVEYGGYLRDADRRKETAKLAELEDRLVALWQAGELEACLAVNLQSSYDPVALDATGTIPAWAALRAVWAGWLDDKGYRQPERATPHPKALDGVRVVVNLADGEDVEGEDLAALAGDFLADCKKRPWGRNLPAPKSADLTALGFFLTTVSTPLTPDEAPDLGRVAWEVFRKSEKEAVYYGAGDPDPAASVRNLKPVVAALGGEYSSRFWILDQFYPTDEVVNVRRNLARIVRLVRSMRVSHRAFTYPPRMKEDMTLLVGDLADFFGVSFLTPLQEAIRFLGEVFGEAATFRRTYDLLADEYFGGLPLLGKGTRDKLDQVDIVLAEAEERLADWLNSLQAWPWGVDTTSLQLVKADVDEELARREADDIVAGVLTSSGLKRQGYDLGPEEPPAKDKRP